MFLPDKLRRLLQKYIRTQKKTAGAVFTPQTGKPLDKSNTWRDMKALCESTGVEPGKVFPRNLRHLFARTYYTLEKDLSRLADILGRTFWAIPPSTPPASTPPRAAASTPGRWNAWCLS